ncbi:MAG TPA: universal stress protein [Solirubrobacteraceae bacterium]|jgi:nucleotide-binding universal stress UspA family protein|nr:universal stress protein [Solirubrobacteraceae bacterium]
MSANIIISYDGTNNEDDAVALGRLFASAGATVSLAYVRHAPEEETSREILAQHEAEELLRKGAGLLGDGDVSRHVITDPSTPGGLSKLAAQTGADVIVFCSDSHTAKGSVTVGNSAQRLLNGGTVAVAIAPAGYAQNGDSQLARGIAVTGDGGAQATAEALARAFGAELVAAERDAGLIVVGSRPEAEEGRVSLSAASENLIENAGCPVLVVPRGKALAFDGHVIAAV